MKAHLKDFIYGALLGLFVAWVSLSTGITITYLIER